MSFFLKKFKQAAETLLKRPVAKDARKLQFESDINRLFLFTSYNRLGKEAVEAEMEEIIKMADKATIADQEKIVQDNIHSQIINFTMSMDKIFLPHTETSNEPIVAPRPSGLSLAIGGQRSSTHHPDAPAIRQLNRLEVSQNLKHLFGYTLDIKPSQIPHKEAGQGLFLNGEANVGSVLAIYPGVIYSPAYYEHIPGYPRVGAQNPYLITRYDGNVINAQPWGLGDETRGIWSAFGLQTTSVPNVNNDEKGPGRVLKSISRPSQEDIQEDYASDIIERRNPLALAHYANHPPQGTLPNVMICPYNFPLAEKDMRVYIPNIVFGSVEEPHVKKFGKFWLRYGSSLSSGSSVPVLKTLVLVATKAVCNEEVLLNYRLSNLKRRPEWYTPVDEDEDIRRWS